MSAFEELGVCPALIRAASDAGWLLPTATQAEAVPLILGGGDVLVAAETGSGKTGAFGVPVLQVVHESLRGTALARVAAGGGGSDTNQPVTAVQTAASVTMSASDRDEKFAVSPCGTRVQARETRGWAGGRATVGVTSGKHYYEATVTDDGLVRVGWSTKDGKNDALGGDSNSFGFGGTGKKSHWGKFTNCGVGANSQGGDANNASAGAGTSYAKGDTVGCCLDADKGTLKFTKNGVLIVDDGKDGVSFTFDAEKLLGNKNENSALFPAVCLKNAECELRFVGFKHEPPGGYVSIASASPTQWVSGDTDSDDVPEGAKNEEQSFTKKNAPAPSRRTPLALILEPTRELAEQTFDFFTRFSVHLKDPCVKTALCVGGGGASGTDGKKHQTDLLRTGVGIDVVVGTPGRVLELCESGVLCLKNIRFFVLDEADALLAGGTLNAIHTFKQKIPKHGSIVAQKFGRVQTLLFSATLRSPKVRALATALCDRNAVWVDLKGYDHVPDTVQHVMIDVTPDLAIEKSPGCDNYLKLATQDGCHEKLFFGNAASLDSDRVKKIKPMLLRNTIQALGITRALIFCRTNWDCELLKRFFDAVNLFDGNENLSSACLGGGLSNDTRRVNLQKFKNNQVRFLICTDVAARGIDLNSLDFLINVTLPDTAEEYVHRVGRVGRAGKPGLAISLVSGVAELVWFVKKKGYKPWLNLDPATHKDDRKQHTVWIDETKTLLDIETRLKEEITRLDVANVPDSLTKSSEKFLPKNTPSGTVTGISAGEKKRSEEVKARLDQYAPATRRLVQLEVDAQRTFWALKRKFAE